METTDEKKIARVAFAALDPYIERNIILPTETIMRGKDMVQWGDRNIYPEYIEDLAKNAPTLHSVIRGTADFIIGNEQHILGFNPALAPDIMNRKGDTIRQQVDDVALDLCKIGGLALQVIRDRQGHPAEVYHLPVRRVRSNKENTVFYYSEDWDKFRQNAIRYPAFMPGLEKVWGSLDEKAREEHASSVLFVKLDRSQVYPSPLYCAAVKACETERGIADYHLNAITNNFVASAIVNFNQGEPTTKIKEEVERDFTEKFSGHTNGGRILFSWNDDRTHATTFDFPKVEDFGARYKALEKSVRQQIFTAFRATPTIFGIPTDNNGFSNDDYDGAFRLYNRTMVRPLQQVIIEAYERIFGAPGVLTITPFSLGEDKDDTIVK